MLTPPLFENVSGGEPASYGFEYLAPTLYVEHEATFSYGQTRGFGS